MSAAPLPANPNDSFSEAFDAIMGKIEAASEKVKVKRDSGPQRRPGNVASRASVKKTRMAFSALVEEQTVAGEELKIAHEEHEAESIEERQKLERLRASTQRIKSSSWIKRVFG